MGPLADWGVPQASLPLTISWCTPPPARGNRPQTGTWRPACPRAASASTRRSWPHSPRRPLLRSRAPAGPRPLARPRSPWPPGLPSAPPAPSVGTDRRRGPGAALPAAAGARRGVWLRQRGRLGRVGSLERRAASAPFPGAAPPSEGQAGGAPGGAGAGGGAARLPGPRAAGAWGRRVAGGGGARGRPGPQRLRPARRRGVEARAGRGRRPPATGAALASAAPAASLPARSAARCSVVARFLRPGKETQKGEET